VCTNARRRGGYRRARGKEEEERSRGRRDEPSRAEEIDRYTHNERREE
jgi:hypothetical protein